MPFISHTRLVEILNFVEHNLNIIFLCIFTSAGEHTDLVLGRVKGKIVLGFSTLNCCISRFSSS